MESPGEYLKREREHRGVSLADIFKATRVPLKHLEALEADSYDAMPHPTFIKGYIRSYCKVLGVDETDAVLRYEIYLKDKAGSAEGGKPQARPQRSRKIQRPPLFGQFWGDKRNIIMAAIVAAAVVILIAAYLVFGLKSPDPVEVPMPMMEEQTAQEAALDAVPAPVKAIEKEPVQEAAPPSPVKAVEEPAPVKAVEKVTEPVKAVEKVAEKKAVQEPAPMRHSLVVKATETVWIQVVIDKGRPFDVTLKQGETVAWKAAEAFTLKIGNAGGVSLSFNGKQMAPVGKAGYVVSLDLPGGKVKVLSGPTKAEEEPGPRPEPAPGVGIKELLPPIAPMEDIKSLKPAAAMEEDIKSLKPAAPAPPAP